ncbi:MAG: hypothetical protein QXS02_03370 [Candidatus Thermoplasmatota archaeon]
MRFIFKIFTIFLTLALLSTVIPLGASYDNTMINSEDNVNYEYEQDDILTDDMINRVLESITINDLVTCMEGYIDEMREDSGHKNLMSTSVREGLEELAQLGIKRDTSLFKAQNILKNSILKQGGNIKYRWFMIGVFPVIVRISTILPRVTFNLTKIPSPLGNLTVKLELFVKAVPFIDSITLREPRLILPGLTQTTRIWPAIGAHITIQGVTLFIMAYGPRIKWVHESTNILKNNNLFF